MRLAVLWLAGLAACGSSGGGGSGGADASSSGTDAGADASSEADVDAAAGGESCDLAMQDGCEDGQACDIDWTDEMGTACRDVTAPGEIGDTCGEPTECAAGFVCDPDGACQAYCGESDDCGQPRGQCVMDLEDQVTCSSNCDPAVVDNELCPPDWACDLFVAQHMELDHDVAICREAGDGTQGDLCDSPTACAAGYFCVNDGGNDICARICKRPGGAECNVETCQAFGGGFTIGGQEYGVCL